MTVGVLGLGLIGGSMARAYAHAGHRVLAFDTDDQILQFSQIEGTVSDILSENTVCQCDLIILAVYSGASGRWMEANAFRIRKDCLVIDCCGIKEEICDCCFPLSQKYGFTFVGGHPMAGSQFSGYKYSRRDLFQGAPMVIVPPQFDDASILERVSNALAPCGFGSYSVTTALEHDEIIAFTSQLPHIISNAYIKSPTAIRHKGYSAGSYRDLTRVAWLNPQMWAELFMDNKEFLLPELDTYISHLSQYRAAMQDNDRDRLEQLLTDGRNRKKEIDP